jgi:hypothetical protein
MSQPGEAEAIETKRRTIAIGPGWRAQRRPVPQLGHLIGAAGGALAVLAPIFYGYDSATSSESVSGTTGAALCFLAVAVALVGMHWLPGPARAACTSVVAVGIAAFWVFALEVRDSPGKPTVLLALLTLSYAAVYLVGPARGRGILLALALLVAWNFVVAQVTDVDDGFNVTKQGDVIGHAPTQLPGVVTAAAWSAGRDSGSGSDTTSDTTQDCFDVPDDEFSACLDEQSGNDSGSSDSGGSDSGSDFSIDSSGDNSDFSDQVRVSTPLSDKAGEVGSVSLAFGVLYLAGAIFADRRKYYGIATPLVGVGLVAALVGAYAIGTDSEKAWLFGVLFALAGLGVAFVGSRNERRATTWIGAGAVAIGVGIVCGDLADDSADTFSILALLGGVLLAAAGVLLAHIEREHPDGDPEAPRPVAPSPETSSAIEPTP